jgi:DNA polymerase (family 10)
VNNLEAAWSLNEIADLLEIKGENPYKIRAYKRAAASITNLQLNLEDLYKEGSLRDVPGVGKAIAEKLEEMITTGKCSMLEKLREEIPPVFRSIPQLPGVGLHAARVIYNNTDIKDLEQLEIAARQRKIRALPGLGPKTEVNIIRGLEIIKTQRDSSPLNLASASAEILVGFLSSLDITHRVALSGSIRRGKDTVHDVDIVASVDDKKFIAENFAKHPHVKEVSQSTDNRIEGLTWLGVKFDVMLVEEQEFIPVLFWTTGSKEFFRELTVFAAGKGCRLTGNQVIVDDRVVPVKDEKEIFELLGLSYIPPQIREGPEVIRTAGEGRLPCLIEISDIKGDLHCHSAWSDGIHTIEELVQEAISRGYSYLAITDHSKSLAIANGLSWERLQAQWKEIEKLQYEYSPFKIFKGLEVDILKDGLLDFGEEVLSRLDIVIASVHSGFRQDLETMTSRLVSALENPYVDIIAHPTGRILGRRPPYNLDLDRFIEVAAKTGTILEINASPDRLDLSAENTRRAKENGILIAINTDAHDKVRLQDIAFGVTNARRGWLEKSDVLNTYSKEEVEEILKDRRRKALLK